MELDRLRLPSECSLLIDTETVKTIDTLKVVHGIRLFGISQRTT